jgi:hypothetical protein
VTPVASHNPGATFPGGTTTVTYTFTDAAGNTDTCVFDVTVLGFTTLVADVQLEAITQPVTRCFTFTLVNCTTQATTTLKRDMDFNAAGLASATFTDLPCGEYDCITAEDELHTLRVRLDSAPAFGIVGGQYLAHFTGANLLTTADYYNDNVIDIVDYGVFHAQWGTRYDSNNDSIADGNTPCGKFTRHADANGDGFLDISDFNPISGNFLAKGARPCCAAALEGPPPRTAITVRELQRMGVPSAWRADLNSDGWIDATDIQLFLSGKLPPPLPTVEQAPVPVRALRENALEE